MISVRVAYGDLIVDVEDLTTRCAWALLATLQHLKIQAQQ